jgi:hypothetical protein
MKSTIVAHRRVGTKRFQSGPTLNGRAESICVSIGYSEQPSVVGDRHTSVLGSCWVLVKCIPNSNGMQIASYTCQD